MTTWDACTMEPNRWLRWIECHPGLAGYIQAIGIIATLALALFGPPLFLLVNRVRDWWATRLDAIYFARAARKDVRAMMEQIDTRRANLPTFKPGVPWRGGAHDMSLTIPPNLGLPAGAHYGHRFAFLRQFLEEVIAYNTTLSTMTQAAVPDNQLDIIRNQIRESLKGLKASAVLVCTKLDAMKLFFPWSRHAHDD